MTDEWAAPEPRILDRLGERLDTSETDVLATVVAVDGTAYRRPGAKMLVEADGDAVGSVTAGCLTAELRDAAHAVRESGRPELRTFDLTTDDDWGLGIGCDGVVDVLLAPVSDVFRPIVDANQQGRDVAVLTALSTGETLSQGDRALFIPDADRFEPITGDWPTEELRDAVTVLAHEGGADVLELDREETASVFVDAVAAPPDLVVVGSGRDAAPVVELGARNGFRVTVVGFRGGVDLSKRFPIADHTVTTAPADVREAVDFDSQTYAVVMTHNFVDDRLAVGELLDSPAPYVGLMGPRDRFEKMQTAFEEEGAPPPDAALDSLYTPVGLDLGGGSPHQIAHSIVAEALAVHNDRTPKHLRDRRGSIHDRTGHDDDE